MKSIPSHRIFNLYNLLRVLVAGIIFGTLSFIPIRGTPSLASWVEAYIRGEGDPHFVIAGTQAGRIREVFTRFPGLDPNWREVPPEENGYVLLREFLQSKSASKLTLTDGLREMLAEDWKWNEAATRGHLEKNREALSELRRICLLPDQSAQGKSAKEVLKATPYKNMTDALLLSFKQNLRNKQMAEALTDFSALYGFAAHLDRHEVPNFRDKTAAIQVRLAPQDALCKALKDTTADMDWSPWIRILQNEPSYGRQMEALIRGEAWSCLQLSPVWAMVEKKKNPIWDFTEFENAFAQRMLANSKAYANATKLTDLNGLKKIKDELARENPSLSKAAREMLQTMQIDTKGEERNAIQAEARCNLTLAALQLIQSEKEEGPIQSTDDMRLGSLAIDPSNGLPFVYDSPLRELLPAKGSALVGQEPVKLPRW